MKLNLKARSWHTWASIILALPILIVGASAVFIAHKKSLNTEDITCGRIIRRYFSPQKDVNYVFR